MPVANGLLHLLHIHTVWRCPGSMLPQDLLQRFRLVTVVHRSDRQTALTRIDAGIGVGAMPEQQLRDLNVISATGLVKSETVRSQVTAR